MHERDNPLKCSQYYITFLLTRNNGSVSIRRNKQRRRGTKIQELLYYEKSRYFILKYSFKEQFSKFQPTVQEFLMSLRA